MGLNGAWGWMVHGAEWCMGLNGAQGWMVKTWIYNIPAYKKLRSYCTIRSRNITMYHISTDLNVSTMKWEIANCVLAAVYIPIELWGSFYHWVEWQNITCTQHTSCKTCKKFKCFTLNFLTIIVPKWTSSTLDDPNLIKLWNV